MKEPRYSLFTDAHKYLEIDLLYSIHMVDDEPALPSTDDELFEAKKKALTGRGGRSAVKKTFRSTDMEAFQAALKEKPDMTWLEYFASLIPKKK